MTYIVYAGMTEIYEQEHQYKALLKRFDFDNFGLCFLLGQSCAEFLNEAEGDCKIITTICGITARQHGPDAICVEIRVYINFELESDAVQFKLTYEPNKPEW